jgi:hypothetical protein
MRRDGEGELFPNHRRHIHAGRPRGQRVEIRIVHRLGIAGEDGRVDLDVDFLEHFRQASATFATDDGVQTSPPEILPFRRGLKLSVDRHGTDQVEVESLEDRITGAELSTGTHETALQVPDIHSQHSLLR